MGKVKLARKRKYSHRQYKLKTILLDKPYNKFDFHLRNLSPEIINVPSINNFSKIFEELTDKNVLVNRWTLVQHTNPFLLLSTFSTSKTTTPAAKKTVIVNEDLSWIVLIANKNVSGKVTGISNQLENPSDFIKLLDFADSCVVCPGILCNDSLIQFCKRHNNNGAFKDNRGIIKAQLMDGNIVRPTDCSYLLEAATSQPCQNCKAYRKCLLTKLSREKRKELDHKPAKTQVNSHCPWKYLTAEEHKERVKNCREDRQKKSKRIAQLEEKFKKDSVALQPDDDEAIEGLFNTLKSSYTSEDPNDFKTLFLQQQEKALNCSDKRGRRWHPLIIRWCFQLHATSPRAYKMLKESGILTLPDSRTLRDYSNCFKAGIGFDSAYLDLVKQDFLSRCKPKECDSWIGIIHDEVSLRQELVFDDSGSLIGFVDLGSPQNSIDKVEKSLSSEGCSSPEEATHMFVFMAVSLFSDWKMPIAFFPTTTIKSFALFNLFWQCVEELEERDLKVLTTTCDGASPHRTFYKFHSKPGTTQGTPIYKTPNPYSEEKRFIFFICDPVHLLKTARNNWENSFWNNKTKKLKNNSMWISWLQLIDAFENDVSQSNASGLRILHKLNANHLFLNPYLRMRVYLAAQVFSNRVACAMTIQGKEGTEETAKFVKNMNDFFDCMNANRVYTKFEFKSVYRSSTDSRLVWLKTEFLKYFHDWEKWAMSQTDVPPKERRKYFISDQTWEGLQICVNSFVEVVQFSLQIPGVEYVVATKFNQDPIEKFFGKLRQGRGAYSAFTCNEFRQSYACASFGQTEAIKAIRRIKRNAGSLLELDPDLELAKSSKKKKA